MKHRFSKALGYGLLLSGIVCISQTALADPINGYVWENAATYVPGGPNPAFSIPSGSPNIAFTLSNAVTPLVFDFYSTTDSNLTGFLTNNGTNNNVVTYTTGANQTSPTPCPTGTSGSCGINNDVMEFTGNTYLQNGNMYSFTHDDGMYLNIGMDQVITAGVPTAAATNTFTWTGSTGVHSYSLYYDEVNGAPAELFSPDFGLTPEPSSLLLLGTGLAGLAFLLFRKREKPATGLGGGDINLV